MKCREIEGHLSAYLAEEISPDLRRSVKGHLKGCKKCRARLDALKLKQPAPEQKERVANQTAERPSPPEERPQDQEKPRAASTEEVTFTDWYRPVGVAVIIALIGGAIYFYNREASDLKSDFSIAERPTPPLAEQSTSSAQMKTEGLIQNADASSPPSSQTMPVPPSSTDSLPGKEHQGTTQPVPKEARRFTTSARPVPIKLLLVSRNIKEATNTISDQAVASQGRVLSKKGDEMQGKVVLLIPSERYEAFSKSLQSLGLVKNISKKQPPSEGSLKIEVMIE